MVQTVKKTADNQKPLSKINHRSRHLVIILTGLFFLIFGIVLFVGYERFENTLNKALLADDSYVNVFAELLFQHEKATIGILESYASRPLFVKAVKQKDTAVVHTHMINLNKNNREMDFTFITDKTGLLWANHPIFPEAIGKDLSDRDWYKNIESNWKPYVSEVFKLIVGNKPLAVTVCVPVFGEDGVVIGILANSQRLSFLNDILTRIHINAQTKLSIVDKAGNIIYSSSIPYSQHICQYPHYSTIKQTFKEKSSQIELNDPRFGKGKTFLTFKSIESIGWTVIIERGLNETFYSERGHYIIMGARALVLFLLIAILVLYRNTLYLKSIEHNRVEENFHSSQSKLQALIDGTTDAVYIKDLKGRYLLFNKAASRVVGKYDEVIGHDDTYILPFNEALLVKEVDRRVMDSGKPLSYVETLTSHNSELITFHSTKGPLFDSKGNLEGIFGISRDVTSLLKTEEALQQSETDFRETAVAVGFGVYKYDHNDDRAFYSPEFLALFGLLPGTQLELDTDHVAKAIHPDDKQSFLTCMQASNDPTGKGCLEHEYRIIRPEGQIRWLRVFGKTIFSGNTKSDRPLHSSGFIQDISNFKNMEADRNELRERLSQTQKLESLGLLAGGIAHEFNNLMSGIFGYIDLAIEESISKETSDALAKAAQTIDRGRSITAKLLTFAKGGAPIKKNEHLTPIIHEATKLALTGSNVSYRYDIHQDLWECSCDKNQIYQVIDNIITNAKQAMPAGGAVELTARNITLRKKEHPLLGNGKFVKISIQDHGSGIPKEMHSKIFDPFFTTKPTSRGLGLTISYSIIHRHDGVIDIDSKPNNGSTFHIYLPADSGTPSTTRSKISYLKKSGLFIVMDDEQIMRDIMTNIFESLGYSVKGASDGKEALEIFTAEINVNHCISGVILDLTVPGGMGGKKAVEEIRKLNSDIPIFVTSGYADDPVMKNPSEFGFTASICKPFRKQELVNMLENFTNK